MSKPIVLIAEELSPATVDALGPDFEIRNCDGANRTELLAELAKGVDAVLIRSATKMDQEAIAAAKGLKVIARAGVGRIVCASVHKRSWTVTPHRVALRPSADTRP